MTRLPAHLCSAADTAESCDLPGKAATLTHVLWRSHKQNQSVLPTGFLGRRSWTTNQYICATMATNCIPPPNQCPRSSHLPQSRQRLRLGCRGPLGSDSNEARKANSTHLFPPPPQAGTGGLWIGSHPLTSTIRQGWHTIFQKKNHTQKNLQKVST